MAGLQYHTTDVHLILNIESPSMYVILIIKCKLMNSHLKGAIHTEQRSGIERRLCSQNDGVSVILRICVTMS